MKLGTGFLKKIYKIDKPLAKLIKKKSTQINKSQMRGDKQPILQKYKQVQENIMKNYMPTNWTPRRNG